MSAWQLQEAKNKLSELIDRAIDEGPQIITRHGVEVVVVMRYARYRELTTPQQKLGDFFMSSPLRESGIEIVRDRRSEIRDLDL